MSLVKKLVYRKLIFGVMVSILLVITPGCTWLTDWFGGFMEDKYGAVKNITAEDLKKHMNKSYDLLVINVLSKESFDDCRIKGSLHVDLKDIPKAAERWNKNQEMVVYCASYQCSASKEAFLKLKELGFTNISAYEGGVKEWKQKGFSLVGPCKADYLK